MTKEPSRRESGQAMVEAAITMPLALFLMLGLIQLFMMMQGRILAQYAAARIARVGSLNHGACGPMRQTAVAALLPAFARTTNGEELAQQWELRRNGKYNPAWDAGYDEDIFWLIRRTPVGSTLNANTEERFNSPELEVAGAPNRFTLGIELTFWYPLRIPFANYVIAYSLAARSNVRQLPAGVNPLMPTERDPDWSGGATLDTLIGRELGKRIDSRHYAIPIRATYAMRMMSPPRERHFANQGCPDPSP